MQYGYQQRPADMRTPRSAPTRKWASYGSQTRRRAALFPGPMANAQVMAGCWARLTSYTPGTLSMARIRAGSRAASGSWRV